MISTLQAIEVKGKNVVAFLNGLSTSDVKNQSFNAFCNDQGKVMALALMMSRGEDGYWVCVDQSLVSNMVAHFEFYGRFSRVRIRPIEGRIDLNDECDMVDVATDQDWLAYQYEKGLPFLDLATTAKYTPQMLGYDIHGLINWHKGCYLGQEVVTRISHLGKSKRHLYQVWKACDLAPVLESSQGALIVMNEAQAKDLAPNCRRITQL